MNSEEKKKFQNNLKTIATFQIPDSTPPQLLQSVIGKGDAQLDRLCSTVDLMKKNLLTAQRSLVEYAKSRLEKQ